MPDNTPVLDSLAALNAVSLAEGTLDAREHMLARLAALVAVGAPDASYLLNAGAAADAGVTLEDVQGVLIAVAPIVGTPRVLAGAGGVAHRRHVIGEDATESRIFEKACALVGHHRRGMRDFGKGRRIGGAGLVEHGHAGSLAIFGA